MKKYLGVALIITLGVFFPVDNKAEGCAISFSEFKSKLLDETSQDFKVDTSGNVVIGNDCEGPFIRGYPENPWIPETFHPDIVVYPDSWSISGGIVLLADPDLCLTEPCNLSITNYSLVENDKIIPQNFTFRGDGIITIYSAIGSRVCGTDGVSCRCGSVYGTSDVVKNGHGILILNKVWAMKTDYGGCKPSEYVIFDSETEKYIGTERSNPKVFMNIDVNNGILVLLGAPSDILQYGYDSDQSKFYDRSGALISGGNISTDPIIKLGNDAKIVFWGAENGISFKSDASYDEVLFDNWIKSIVGLDYGKDDSRLFFNSWPG